MLCVRSYYLLFTETIIEWIVVRPVHGLGRFSFGPNPNSTFQHQVEGGRTRNRPLCQLVESVSSSSVVGLVRLVVRKCISHWKLQKFCPNYKFQLKIYVVWLDLAKSHQIQSRTHQIWLDFVRFGRSSCITMIRFGLLGFWRSKPTT